MDVDGSAATRARPRRAAAQGSAGSRPRDRPGRAARLTPACVKQRLESPAGAYRKLTNCSARPNSLFLTRAITACRSSFFFEDTRSSSPWTWARTPLGPSSLISLEIFLASSCEMPSLRLTPRRNSLPEGFGSPGSSALSDTPRRTSLSLNTSRTALARSSLLARISTDSPDQEMAAPTPRKSNRLLISLAAWFSALSTSCRSTLLTMSKNDSAIGSLLSTFCPRVAQRPWRFPDSVPGARRNGHAWLPCDGPAPGSLSFTVPCDCGGARQVARVAKGNGL